MTASVGEEIGLGNESAGHAGDGTQLWCERGSANVRRPSAERRREYGSARHVIGRRGVAWRGVAWRGVAWRGVAWHGTAY
jgi:hypothetical protein